MNKSHQILKEKKVGLVISWIFVISQTLFSKERKKKNVENSLWTVWNSSLCEWFFWHITVVLEDLSNECSPAYPG